MTIRLIATDVDGTLLNSENVVPPVNARALRVAIERGVRLVLVSARKERSLRATAAELGLPSALIAHNGARTWDWDGRLLRDLTVPSELALTIADFADEHAIALIVTVDEVNYYGPGEESSVIPFGFDERPAATNRSAVVGSPSRIIAVGERAVNLLSERLGNATGDLMVHRYYSRLGAVYSAVMTHPQANKAEALDELCRSAAIASSEVLALGDAEADVPMLMWAGVGVAMGNAMPEARSVATWVAPDHDAAGLATAVERFVLAPAVG
ncbi:MAG: Cof-type HAD-IIB family hydrolase [Herpetosiphon sp.]